jgi:hypothetical protein
MVFLETSVFYDFRIKLMFSAYLPPVVCRQAYVIFTLFVFVYAVLSNTYCVVFWLCFSSSCVLYVASFFVPLYCGILRNFCFVPLYCAIRQPVFTPSGSYLCSFYVKKVA